MSVRVAVRLIDSIVIIVKEGKEDEGEEEVQGKLCGGGDLSLIQDGGRVYILKCL